MEGAVHFDDLGDGRFQLAGELGFETVTGALEASELLFAPHAALDICLARISRSDSAAVALLIEWQSRARAANRSVVFRNPPAQLLAVARLSDVDGVLAFV